MVFTYFGKLPWTDKNVYQLYGNMLKDEWLKETLTLKAEKTGRDHSNEVISSLLCLSGIWSANVTWHSHSLINPPIHPSCLNINYLITYQSNEQRRKLSLLPKWTCKQWFWLVILFNQSGSCYRPPKSCEILLVVCIQSDTNVTKHLSLVRFWCLFSNYDNHTTLSGITAMHCLASFWKQTNTKTSSD